MTPTTHSLLFDLDCPCATNYCFAALWWPSGHDLDTLYESLRLVHDARTERAEACEVVDSELCQFRAGHLLMKLHILHEVVVVVDGLRREIVCSSTVVPKLKMLLEIFFHVERIAGMRLHLVLGVSRLCPQGFQGTKAQHSFDLISLS